MGSTTTAPLTTQHSSPYTRSPSRSPQPRSPPTDTEKADMRQRLLMYPHQQDTDAGQAAYRHQIAQWSATWGGNDIVTHMTPVPLRLGTAAVCSGKCYRCGTHGHKGIQCPVPSGHANCLTQEESRWRVICAYMLGQPSRAQGTQVYLLDTETEMWQEWDRDGQHGDQGNGGGSAA
jgi:hypothetical protein